MKCNPWVGGSIGRRGFPMLGTGKRGLSTLIKEVFRNGEQGVFYDPFDISTMYQNAVGTSPVSETAQPLGLFLDKSKGLVVGPEKYTDKIPTIDGSAGGAVYTFTPATKTFTINTAGTVNGYPRINFNLGLETGKRYIVSGRISGDTAIVNGVRLATVGSANALLFSQETGVFTGIQRADGPLLNILMNGTLLGSITVSSISVKEISGNHAYQTTSAARPLFRQVPIKEVTGYRTDRNYIEYDGVDDKLLTTFAAPLTNCTVVRAVPNEGTKILYNQTLPASYESTLNHSGFFAINRALSNSEKVLLLNEMDKRTGITSLDSQVARSFANNEVGVAFNDFNDMSVLFQDASGTIPVTAAGQPVGLILDKSKGMVLGDELNTGSWSVGVGWSVNSSVATHVSGVAGALNIQGAVESKFYKITAKITVRAGVLQLFTNGNLLFSVSDVGTQTHTFYGWSSTSVNGRLIDFYAKSSFDGDVDLSSISIKEISGNHAYQTVSASRPLLAYTPVNGVRNIATQSTDAADASWNFTGTRTSGVADSKGRLNAVRWSGVSNVPTKVCTVQKTGVHTVTMRLKVESASGACTVLVRNNTKNTNYVTGTLNGSAGITSGTGWSAKSIGNGFWECTYTTPSVDAGNALSAYFGAVDTTVSTFAIVIESLQVEFGETATPLQKTTTLLNVTEEGVKSTYSLYFDGVDDFLQTNNIDFTSTDKVSVFAGVRKLSDAATSVVAELSATVDGNTGAFRLTAPTGGGHAYQYISRGSTAQLAAANATNLVAPHSAVISAKSDINADISSLRINGLLKGTSASDQGTGNYGNHPLYIGRRAGTNLPFNGHLYSLIIMGRLASDAETAVLEKAIAKQVGVTLNV